MVVIKCTDVDCTWKSEDRDVAFAAVLAAELANHTATAHAAPAQQQQQNPHQNNSTKVKVDLPKITTGVNE